MIKPATATHQSQVTGNFFKVSSKNSHELALTWRKSGWEKHPHIRNHELNHFRRL